MLIMKITVKDFFGMMEGSLYAVYVDLYSEDDCENPAGMLASDVVEEYSDREIVSFGIGYEGISVTIKGALK